MEHLYSLGIIKSLLTKYQVTLPNLRKVKTTLCLFYRQRNGDPEVRKYGKEAEQRSWVSQACYLWTPLMAYNPARKHQCCSGIGDSFLRNVVFPVGVLQCFFQSRRKKLDLFHAFIHVSLKACYTQGITSLLGYSNQQNWCDLNPHGVYLLLEEEEDNKQGYKYAIPFQEVINAVKRSNTEDRECQRFTILEVGMGCWT